MSDDRFGIVKPADKNEKIEKTPQPAKKEEPGTDNKLQSELVKADLLQPKKKKIPKVKVETETKKEEGSLKQRLDKYSNEVIKRHPNVPGEIIAKIKSSESYKAAKRILKEWLKGENRETT